MSRFPEQIQFRAAPGTSIKLQSKAEAEGKRIGDVVREAVEKHLATAANQNDPSSLASA